MPPLGNTAADQSVGLEHMGCSRVEQGTKPPPPGFHLACRNRYGCRGNKTRVAFDVIGTERFFEPVGTEWLETANKGQRPEDIPPGVVCVKKQPDIGPDTL